MTNFNTTIKEIAEEYIYAATSLENTLHTCDDYDDFDTCTGCQMVQHGFVLLDMIGDLSVLDNFR
jgi:hypothetical protein